MRPPTIVVASVCAVAAVAGCGGASATSHTAASLKAVAHAPASAACTAAAEAEVVAIARRISSQAAAGRNTAAATRRIERSVPLAQAVAAGDKAATRAALAPLIKHQITRIEIAGAHGTLARNGTTPAYGPVRGSISLRGRPVGSYVLAVSRQHDFESLVHGLTGATATFHAGTAARARGSLAATTFPRGRAVVTLSVPHPPATVCRPTAADTRAATVGLVARRLLQAEEHGSGVQRALRHAEQDPAMRAAVAAGDPAAVRAAIIGFFQDKRFHIVRARAWKGTHLINDVGGPYVLSPAVGRITDARGAVIGSVMLSIQDDTGYIKLMHRFTGADVTLSTPARVVPGSNVMNGPAFAPGLHTVRYAGRDWRDYGLTATAFPSGPLRVSLLIR
jgi:hypothetical protein